MKEKETEFAGIVKAHKNTIYTVCYLFSKDNGEVNDLFQETLINLWRGFDSFKGQCDVESAESFRHSGDQAAALFPVAQVGGKIEPPSAEGVQFFEQLRGLIAVRDHRHRTALFGKSQCHCPSESPPPAGHDGPFPGKIQIFLHPAVPFSCGNFPR